MKVDYREPVFADVELPEEIWIIIFRHLDTKSLHNSQLVCKKWVQTILNDVILSGEYTLKNVNQSSQREMDSFVSKRTKLKILRCPSINFHWDIWHKLCNPDVVLCDLRFVDYDYCKDLKKVISGYHTYLPYIRELPEWASVQKVWFDPHNIPKRFVPENVISLAVRLASDNDYLQDKSLEGIGKQMTHLETLIISFSRSVQNQSFLEYSQNYYFPLLMGLLTGQNLKQLEIWFTDEELEYSHNLRYNII